jgi:gamma-glutamyltranspeptidase
VIRFPNGTATTIDFREKAPLAADPKMWLDDMQMHGLAEVDWKCERVNAPLAARST